MNTYYNRNLTKQFLVIFTESHKSDSQLDFDAEEDDDVDAPFSIKLTTESNSEVTAYEPTF